MSGDYKKLLTKKKKKYCDTKTMGVNIDKNEYYEIILSNSAHPENIINSVKKAFTIAELVIAMITISLIVTLALPNIKSQINKVDDAGYYLAYKTAVDISQNVINKYDWDTYLKQLSSISTYETTIAEVQPSLANILQTRIDATKAHLYTKTLNVSKDFNNSIIVFNPLNYIKANALLDNAMICYGTCNGGEEEVQETACSSNWVLTHCSCISGYEWNDAAKICQKSCSSNQILCTKYDTCVTCGNNAIFNPDTCECNCITGFKENNDKVCTEYTEYDIGICTITSTLDNSHYVLEGNHTANWCNKVAKNWSLDWDGTENIYSGQINPTGAIGYYAGEEEETPIPKTPGYLKPLCNAIKVAYSIKDKYSSCPTNSTIINAATDSGDFSQTEPNIVMHNGLMIYITSDKPTSIPSLQNATGSTTISKDNYGFTIYIDINGKRGKGLLYEDVFPFYLTLSGKTIPAYPMSILDLNDEDISTGKIKYAGGNNSEHLSLNVVYDDFSENKLRTKLLMRNANFRSAACSIGYVASATKYCNNKLPYNICNEELSPDNIAHNCRFWVQRPFRFFR